MIENQQLIQMMKDMLPKSLPTYEMNPFEQGILAGQQIMLDKILTTIQANEPDTMTKDK